VLIITRTPRREALNIGLANWRIIHLGRKPNKKGKPPKEKRPRVALICLLEETGASLSWEKWKIWRRFSSFTSNLRTRAYTKKYATQRRLFSVNVNSIQPRWLMEE